MNSAKTEYNKKAVQKFSAQLMFLSCALIIKGMYISFFGCQTKTKTFVSSFICFVNQNLSRFFRASLPEGGGNA